MENGKVLLEGSRYFLQNGDSKGALPPDQKARVNALRNGPLSRDWRFCTITKVMGSFEYLEF